MAQVIDVLTWLATGRGRCDGVIGRPNSWCDRPPMDRQIGHGTWNMAHADDKAPSYRVQSGRLSLDQSADSRSNRRGVNPHRWSGPQMEWAWTTRTWTGHGDKRDTWA